MRVQNPSEAVINALVDADIDQLPLSAEPEGAPSVVESDLSSVASSSASEDATSTEVPTLIRTVPQKKPLQWEFEGLTLWLEYEEFDMDLTKANYHFAGLYGTEVIPRLHSTAIYGMHHLSVQQAKERLAKIPGILPQGGKWPVMEHPVAIKQDISQVGLPGQVANIAWAELTMKTNHSHEEAMDAVFKLFEVERGGPWTPHLSLAYDNPEDSSLQLSDIIGYAMENPTLLKQSRRITAVSLWSTEGKLGDWECLDRVHLL
jgi:hypothetical protein